MLTNIRSFEPDTNTASSANRIPQLALFSRKPVVAAGLVTTVGTSFHVVGIFDDLKNLPESIAKLMPNVLVMEVSQDVTLETIQQIRELSPATAIVLWIDKVPAEFIGQSLSLGVTGILKKTSSVDKHVECLSEVVRGRVSVDRDVAATLLTGRKVHLTPRERQIVALLSQGLPNKEVAWRLGLTPGTVKVYISRLFDKVGVGDRFELALMALRNTGGEWNAPTGPAKESDSASWVPSQFVNVQLSAAA